MQQTIIQERESYTSAWICFFLGLFFWPLLIVSIILFITKSNSAPKTVNVIIHDDQNNANNSNINSYNSQK